MRNGARQQGVALITALLIVAIATIAAAQLMSENGLNIRRTGNLVAMDQALLYALGAEAWVIEILKQDSQESDIDYLGEVWAIPLPPLEVEGGVIQGNVEDMQGRFNLNNLVTGRGEMNESAVEQFQRLLTSLEIDPKFATLAVDWFDVDTQESFPNGAEDSTYTGLDPPYRTANALITSTSELLALADFDYEQYEILRPHIAALPLNTSINVCTATAHVLDAMGESIDEFTREDQQALYEERAEVCYPDLSDIESRLDEEALSALNLSESSSYFRVVTRATIGTVQLTLYSVIERSGGNQVRVILRSFGNE